MDKLGAVIEREVLNKLCAHSTSGLFLGFIDIVKSTLDSVLLVFTVTGSFYLLVLKRPSPHSV
jgi:L-asparagine transporter-like permease